MEKRNIYGQVPAQMERTGHNFKKYEKTVRETEKITGVTKTITHRMKIKNKKIEKNRG
jgi:hypothetical protein